MKPLYIVTGASGYLGRAVVELLLSRGACVRALVHTEQSWLHISSHAEMVFGNVLIPRSLDALFADTAGRDVYVIHSAAKISVKKHDEEAYHLNVVGTKHIIDLCRKHHVKKLVYVSSVDALDPDAADGPIAEPEGEYRIGRAGSDYAKSKADASNLVLFAVENGLDATLVLPSCILGPGDMRGGFTSTMIAVYLIGIPPVSVAGGYDFVDVRDAAAGIVAACSAPAGESYILGGGYGTVTEVFDTLANQLGRRKTALTLPTWVLYPAVPVLWLYAHVRKKPTPITPNAIRLLGGGYRYTHEKAARELGFSPRPLEETVRDTARFIQEQKRIKSERKQEKARGKRGQ